MAKDAYYFPHDSNAIQDPKIMTLMSTCGLVAVAIYWIIIEILHQQDNGKITEEEFKHYLKFYLRDEGKGDLYFDEIQQVFNTTRLLLNTDGYVYSGRVLRNKQLRADLSKKRSLAGKISAHKRLNSSNLTTSVKQVPTSVQLGKESKGKEKKVLFVAPTIEQVVEFLKGDVLEANKFFNHFTANGWKVGGRTPMKDWHAAARNWMLNRANFGGGK